MASNHREERRSLVHKLGDFDLKEGTVIFPSIISIHRSEEIWGEKYMEFIPERFNDLANAMKLLTFAEGPHKCLGYLMAEIQVFIGLINLLSKFSFVFPEDSPHKYSVKVRPKSDILTPVDLKLIVRRDEV